MPPPRHADAEPPPPLDDDASPCRRIAAPPPFQIPIATPPIANNSFERFRFSRDYRLPPYTPYVQYERRAID
jgi:hypothetical protein